MGSEGGLEGERGKCDAQGRWVSAGEKTERYVDGEAETLPSFNVICTEESRHTGNFLIFFHRSVNDRQALIMV